MGQRDRYAAGQRDRYAAGQRDRYAAGQRNRYAASRRNRYAISPGVGFLAGPELLDFYETAIVSPTFSVVLAF